MASQVPPKEQHWLPCKRLMAARGRGSTPASCWCAAQRQGGGADSCTWAEITTNLESAQCQCHTLQAVHMMSLKPTRLLLFTVPHSWLLSIPDKTCTQPKLADAQHWFAICMQIWPVRATAGVCRRGYFTPQRLSDLLQVKPFYIWRFRVRQGPWATWPNMPQFFFEC